MAIKTYKCMYCGKTEEYLVSSDNTRTRCEHCNEWATERVWSSDIPVVRGETCADPFYTVRNQKLPDQTEKG